MLQSIKIPCDNIALAQVTVFAYWPKATTLFFTTWLWDDLCNLHTFVFILVFKSAEKIDLNAREIAFPS